MAPALEQMMIASGYSLPVTLSSGGTASFALLRRIGQAISEFFGSEPIAPSNPRRLDIEVRATEGSDLKIEIRDDVITIRGATLRIRGDRAPEFGDCGKDYF